MGMYGRDSGLEIREVEYKYCSVGFSGSKD